MATACRAAARRRWTWRWLRAGDCDRAELVAVLVVLQRALFEQDVRVVRSGAAIRSCRRLAAHVAGLDVTDVALLGLRHAASAATTLAAPRPRPSSRPPASTGRTPVSVRPAPGSPSTAQAASRGERSGRSACRPRWRRGSSSLRGRDLVVGRIRRRIAMGEGRGYEQAEGRSKGSTHPDYTATATVGGGCSRLLLSSWQRSYGDHDDHRMPFMHH